MRRLSVCIMSAGVMFTASACQEVEEPLPELTSHQLVKVKANLLTQAPTPQHPIGARFEDQIELIGLDIDGPLEAGKPVTLTWTWRALSDIKLNWKIFVHFDASEQPTRHGMDHDAMDGLYPTARWRQGQIIVDRQEVTLPPTFPGGEATFYVGLYRGESRMKITRGAATPDMRVIGPKVQVKGGTPSATRAKARPRHALRQVADDTAFTLDGKLDEPIWQALEPLALQPLGAAPARESWVKMMRHGDALIVGAWMQDEHVWGTLAKRDSNTWTQEVLELFIDTNADERDYLELQITPQNTLFDAHFKTRLGRGEGSREAQIARARAWDMAGLESAVWIDGTLNDEAQVDRGWSVELRLPLASIPGVTAMPRAGETWAMNLYRFDRPKPDQPHAYAWSKAASRDFHEIGAYGQLIFAAPPAPDAPTANAQAAPRGLSASDEGAASDP